MPSRFAATESDIRRFGPFLEAEALRIRLSCRDRDELNRPNRLLACPGVNGEMLYPAWQLDQHGNMVPGLSAVLAILSPAADSWTIARWLRTRADELGVDPVSWLSKGRDPAPVVAAARADALRRYKDR